MTNEENVAMLRDAAEGCCMNDAWRGRTCPYHEGYRDGLDAMQTAMQAEVDGPSAGEALNAMLDQAAGHIGQRGWDAIEADAEQARREDER